MWEINGKEISDETVIRTITCNMDRTHTAALFKYTGPKGKTYRRLTLREAFLLMGFTAEEALTIISAGMKDGAFNTDKLADGLKNFNIRMKEMGNDQPTSTHFP